MKSCINRQLRHRALLGISPLVLACWFGVSTLVAATITQNADDSGSQASFTLGANWSDGLAPSADKDYSTSHVMRTPNSAGSITFAGNSLTMLAGSSLLYKGAASTDVITVNNLTMSGGAYISNYMTTEFTFAGNISLASGSSAGFQLRNGCVGTTVSALISGSGTLAITTDKPSQHASAITLINGANSYSGGTTISTYAFLKVEADGALGTGNLIMNGGKLTLESGVTNNYIYDSANFIVASGLSSSLITLNYSGTDSVAGLSLNGGTSYLDAGIYSVSDLNTRYGSSLFSGTGTITVVPEPQACALLISGFLMLVLGHRTRRA